VARSQPYSRSRGLVVPRAGAHANRGEDVAAAAAPLLVLFVVDAQAAGARAVLQGDHGRADLEALTRLERDFPDTRPVDKGAIAAAQVHEPPADGVAHEAGVPL